MKAFLGVESSSGREIFVMAKDEEAAYIKIAKDLYNMPEPIDTGNVDVDLTELDQTKAVYLDS